MKVSVKWLSDYAALGSAKPEELAKRLTLAGLEVEGVSSPAAALAGVIVVQIKSSVQHPNADKLSVTQVDTGSGAPLQIVCGAKNYKVGDKVPLATVGTKLPHGVEIKQAALRGVESNGMLCSAKELGLAEDASGLLILDAQAKPGTPIAQALGLDDTVFELNVTPNRPDALSHLGVARELAVLSKIALKLPQASLKEGSGKASDKVKIRIDDPERCRRYIGRVVENVKVGPSPAWLTQRLQACGVRSINNVVDVTNYVLLEYGQPMHAFDLDNLAGSEIVVRKATKGEKLTTLDGKERTLDVDDLLICDRDVPQVLAGVMGGAKSEVSEKTTRVLLESANFQPASIRRSSKRHALHSESSHRFERGVDVDAAPLALERAAELLAELAGGIVLQGKIDVYPEVLAKKKVALRFARIGEVLGVDVPADESKRILTSLGFTVEKEANGEATFVVPMARVDVESAEDLIEEVARVRGFDSIPAVMPRGASESRPESPTVEAELRVRVALAGAGFDEVINYSFVSPAELEALGAPKGIALQNPLSVEQSVLRTSMLPGLFQNLSRNVRHQADTILLYEIGRTYLPNASRKDERTPVATEQLHLAGVVHGRRDGRGWTHRDASLDFYDVKGALQAVLAALHVTDVEFLHTESKLLHPRSAALLKHQSGVELGSLGEVHPRVAKKLSVPAGTFVFDLDLESLLLLTQLLPQYSPISRYPAVHRDLAVVVPLELENGDVRKLSLDGGGGLVQDAALFDVYTGRPIPEGRKNLAYAIRYRSPERTLTDDEVNQAHTRIVDEVSKLLGGSLRGANP
ncbi:MAG: phenylalanine--tRNA ligase subunit beta [Myxococcaceae bacterium]